MTVIDFALFFNILDILVESHLLHNLSPLAILNSLLLNLLYLMNILESIFSLINDFLRCLKNRCKLLLILYRYLMQ